MTTEPVYIAAVLGYLFRASDGPMGLTWRPTIMPPDLALPARRRQAQRNGEQPACLPSSILNRPPADEAPSHVNLKFAAQCLLRFVPEAFH
jgi:hypothetical protein